MSDGPPSKKTWRLLRSSRRRELQRSFGFVERSQRLIRRFKAIIAIGTVAIVLFILFAVPTGRWLLNQAVTQTRWSLLSLVGLSPGRDEIDADWRARREYDIGQARSKLAGAYQEYPEPMRRLLGYAGLDPEHALLRWGNFDKTIYLPSTVFEPDDTGRSYRFRPNARSIWIRNLKLKGGILAYFPVPDGPGLAEAAAGTGAQIIAESVQTTNSWGLRGPEPNKAAKIRGIVLGDSYMQGLFVGDDQTPVECLKRELSRTMGVSTEILNTGHLGYSPEQEYYTLREYVDRFRPQFVVLSLFANDFGDLFEVLAGKGDWDEGRYWIGEIAQFCRTRRLLCLAVPAPWINQIEGPRMTGHYPGQVSNIVDSISILYIDPIEAFANEFLRQSVTRVREGKPTTPNPLFNGQLGDGHFSPLGCEVWARAVGKRLRLLIEKDRLERPVTP